MLLNSNTKYWVSWLRICSTFLSGNTLLPFLDSQNFLPKMANFFLSVIYCVVFVYCTRWLMKHSFGYADTCCPRKNIRPEVKMSTYGAAKCWQFNSFCMPVCCFWLSHCGSLQMGAAVPHSTSLSNLLRRYCIGNEQTQLLWMSCEVNRRRGRFEIFCSLRLLPVPHVQGLQNLSRNLAVFMWCYRCCVDSNFTFSVITPKIS